jgi:hypothetical protein
MMMDLIIIGLLINEYVRFDVCLLGNKNCTSAATLGTTGNPTMVDARSSKGVQFSLKKWDGLC